ncbi:hypothetical protein LZ198_18760 [Myxococcus sp. K15C18031901]|uniref:hypothetical protein n=1 Tax=Myxococcus dinghuensis TaxID=2906761 RepID=UPI0020A76534|nr:hypothetical protein [Myxococcus dinghuensis]MCP3100917.1 hypothetical protein [Myxococcus dinghuensis]
MRSPNRVVVSSLTLALCALLMGACGGSPGADGREPATDGLEAAPSTDGTPTGNEGNKGEASEGGVVDQLEVTLCHIPPGNPANAHTISVGVAAVKAHEKHGDLLGACEGEADGGSGGSDGGSGGSDGGGGTCAPVDAACDESVVCCNGLGCSAEGFCEPEIN